MAGEAARGGRGGPGRAAGPPRNDPTTVVASGPPAWETANRGLPHGQDSVKMDLKFDDVASEYMLFNFALRRLSSLSHSSRTVFQERRLEPVMPMCTRAHPQRRCAEVRLQQLTVPWSHRAFKAIESMPRRS